MKHKYLSLIILLLLFVGCNSYVSNELSLEKNFTPSLISVNTPPSFSFLSKNPNNINPIYIQRMQRYDAILQTSPIPVFVMDTKKLPKHLNISLKNKTNYKICGLCIVNHTDPLWPKEFLFININSSEETILTTFFHELQHYKCREKQCYCCKLSAILPDDEQIIASILKEKHAIENELRQAVRLKDIFLIENSISSLGNYLLSNQDIIYKSAAICVVGGRVWNDALDFIAKQKTGELKKL